MEKIKIVGNILGQGSRDNEIFIVTSVEMTGKYRKGSIIAHDTQNETILLKIIEKITRSDISQQDLYLISENERLAYQIIKRSPRSYILKCIIVGAIRDEGKGYKIFNENISFLADKTSEVRNLNSSEKKLIYNRGVLFVGLSVDSSSVSLPINGLLQRHLSVIGMTGCGKSFLIGLLCEELTKYNAAIILIDPHNEYISTAKSLPREVQRMLYGVDPQIGLNTYTLDVKNLSAYDFQHFTNMGEGSTSILARVINRLKKSNAEYTIDDILKGLDNIAQKRTSSEAAAAIWARNYLVNLANTGFIGNKEPSIKHMIDVNKISIISMSGIMEKIQQFVLTSILQRIFNARKKNIIPPLVIIIEEAHRFAPSKKEVSSSSIIRTLATEGRKFGICLIVVSQRPSMLDSTVLSQCVTNIVMKVKNPADLAKIRESAENVTEDVLKELPNFNRGEALIMGESFPVHIRFNVRSNRKTEHGGKNVDFEEIWHKHSLKKEVKRYNFPDEL